MPRSSGPSILAIIPARGGSKGLPGKNIKRLLGKPLLAHSVYLSEQLEFDVRCIVSTDSLEVAAVAREYGSDVPFIRPAELANDTAPMSVVLKHALEEMERIDGTSYDMVLLLDPTSPTRVAAQVDAAIRKLMDSENLDGVISVSEPFFNPTWVGVKQLGPDSDEVGRYFAEGTGVIRRQDVERFLRINGSFYVWRSDFVRRLQVSWFDEGAHGVIEIPETQSYSIDDEHEFRIVEAVVRAGIAPLPGYVEETAT